MRSDRSSSPLTPEKILADMEKYERIAASFSVEKVKADFDDFCSAYGFRKTVLGLEAVGDGAFRDRLGKGASASLSRVARLYVYMHSHAALKYRENINAIIG